MLKELLEKLGAVGIARAVKGEALGAMLGKGKRHIGALAMEERDAGACIMSIKGKAGGYFLLPSDEAGARQALDVFERTEVKHARRVLKTVWRIKKNVQDAYGINLFEDQSMDAGAAADALEEEKAHSVNAIEEEDDGTAHD